jgi:serine/threonine protein kinase
MIKVCSLTLTHMHVSTTLSFLSSNAYDKIADVWSLGRVMIDMISSSSTLFDAQTKQLLLSHLALSVATSSRECVSLLTRLSQQLLAVDPTNRINCNEY